jgi:hypothetical protein
MLSGIFLLILGWWMAIEHPSSAAQIAIGICMCAYGFSIALLAATLLCVQRPLISVTSSSIQILGWPSIPIEEIATSHLVVTTKGSLFTLQASPHYLKSAPLPLGLWLQAHLLVRRNHYQVRASSLDTHPALILDTLDLIAARGPVRPHNLSQGSSSWAYYASIVSIVTLAVPVTRILLEGTLPHTSVLPYLTLFAIFQTSAIFKTIVLAPSR